MKDQLPTQSLLDPLVFQGFSRNESRTTRILRDKYNLRFACFQTLQSFVPAQTVYKLIGTPYYEIFVVRVKLMNTSIETGKLPFLFEMFTSCNRTWTMSRTDVFRVKILEDTSGDVGSSCQQSRYLLTNLELEIPIGQDKGIDYSIFLFESIRDFKLVREETAPP
jgi:hypothetical protein